MLSNHLFCGIGASFFAHITRIFLSEITTDINLWDFGRLHLFSYTPVFVMHTRRVNKSRVYINVTTCPEVPLNTKGIIYLNGLLHHRLPPGRHGAVDRIQHQLSWEKQRAVEAEKRARKDAERARKLEEKKRAEKERLRELAEAQRLLAMECNSDDDFSDDDSELEDDKSDEAFFDR